ncbi:non-ribosomal peptide synthetase [Streptomyces sp. NPDC002676]
MTDDVATATEIICRIWSDLLAMDLEPDDDFFDMGADSLMVVDFVLRARGVGLQVKGAQVFTNPTALTLSAAIRATVSDDQSASRMPHPPSRIISVERAVHEIWKRILERTDIGLDDDFFRIGGTTRTAEQLRKEIGRNFGYEVSLDFVQEARTVGAQAMCLRGSASRSNTSLVRMQTGLPQRPTLYCFHPLGGSIARYAELISSLGIDQPIYGLQSFGLTPGLQVDRTLEQMVERYASEISQHTPETPKIFLGYSLGGVLALETARRLRDSGYDSPAVVLIDAVPYFPPVDAIESAYQALGNALNMDIDVAALTGLPRHAAIEGIRRTAAARELLPALFSLARLATIAEVCEANQEAVNGYRARPFPGELTLFRSSTDTASPRDLGWSEVADKVVVHELDGDHHSIVEREGMQFIAAKLRKVIQLASVHNNNVHNHKKGS